MKNDLKPIVKSILTSTAAFYGLVFILSHFFFNFGKMERKYNVATLNRVRPDFHYLVDISNEGKVEVDQKKMRAYLRYFEQVEKLYPGRSDTYAMMGFCYFYLKDQSKALAYYQKAIQLNPDIFLFYFNQGLVEYSAGHEDQARHSLEQSIVFSPQATVNYLFSSKVYQQIFLEVKILSLEDLLRSFKRKIEEENFLLLAIYFNKHDYTKAMYHAQQGLGAAAELRPLYEFYIGKIFYETKQYFQAAAYFKDLTQKYPQFSESYDALAQTLDAVGKKDMADKIREVKGNRADLQEWVNNFFSRLHPQIY